MKKGLKFWSKLLIVSFFLGGMATSAMAQNGASTAFVDCQKSPMLTFTRTANQMATGTKIPITFTDLAADDEIFFVAKGLDGDNGGQGHLRSVDMECSGIVIGNNLQLGSGTPDDLNNITGFTPNANSSVANGGIRKADFSGSVIVRATDITDAGNYTGGDYYLGVFVKSSTTQCYSDVYYIKINILQNIYASLVLNNGNPDEYICHGTKTTTNIGFTMCNLPGEGTLTYTVTATPGANITGQQVYASGNSGGDMSTGTTWNATINGITPVVAHSQPVTGTVFEDGYTVQIGQQTLFNANPKAAEQIVFSFSNMTYTYVDNGRPIVLPVVFESDAGYCHVGNYDTEFTVHVAPNFRVQALAFETPDERTTHATAHPNLTYYEEANTALTAPTFCQGTIAYFRAINTTTDGTTAYTWTPSNIVLDATNIEAPTSEQLTSTTVVYSSDVLATWNKDSKFGDGCQADTTINITITPAPILLLATDKADMSDAGLADNAILWNTTDQITAHEVCPGQPILIGTADIDFAADEVAARKTYMDAGNYIKANGAALSYTIDPLDNDNLKAYTDWRSTPAADGNLPLLQADGATPGHFLNNQTNDQANITYTVQNAGTTANKCPLVKKDGSALNLDLTNEGQVKIIFPVHPRPQFQLGAN